MCNNGSFDILYREIITFTIARNITVFVSFTGENTRANRKVEVNVRYGTYSGNLTLYIVDCTKHILLGRDWLASMPLKWKSLIRVIGSR